MRIRHEEYVAWIIACSPEIKKALTSDIIYISLPRSIRAELEELWRRHMKPDYKRADKNCPENDSLFKKPKRNSKSNKSPRENTVGGDSL